MPVSLIGTFGIMYLLGYSLDNSLMARAVSTGFVVGAMSSRECYPAYRSRKTRMQAALRGRASRLHRAVNESFADSGLCPDC